MRDAGPVAAVGRDEQGIVVFLERGYAPSTRDAVRCAAGGAVQAQLAHATCALLDRLPTTAAGKIDYGALARDSTRAGA